MLRFQWGMSDIPQEEQMQYKMPHAKNRFGFAPPAALALVAFVTAFPASAGEGGGEGQTLVILPPYGSGTANSVASRPRLFNFGNLDDGYGQQPETANPPGQTSAPRKRAFLIPPDFYKRQVEMHAEQIERLEQMNMQDSESYKAAVIFHQRALQNHQRSLADAEDDDF